MQSVASAPARHNNRSAGRLGAQAPSDLDRVIRWAEQAPTADLQVLVLHVLGVVERRRSATEALIAHAMKAA